MTPEELNALIQQASDPNQAPVALGTLRDKVSELITASTTAKAKAEEDANTIAELRDVNMRLFLRQGTSMERQEKKELTPEELDSSVRAKLIGGES